MKKAVFMMGLKKRKTAEKEDFQAETVVVGVGGGLGVRLEEGVMEGLNVYR